MVEVTLSQILQARDERAQIQQQILSAYRCSLACFTMNIAGPIKYSPLIKRAFLHGLSALEAQIPADRIRYRRVMTGNTGCQAFLAVDMCAKELKSICTTIEDATKLGRLFDMDVLDVNGKKLDRTEQRGCIVCGAVGRSCAATRRHSVETLQDITNHIMHEHFKKYDAEAIASAAVDCLVREVHTTPKPGLVDLRNNGSHTDMTVSTFLTSATALKPYFYECFEIGRTTVSQSADACFSQLRRAGIRAETTMFTATNGINTHKGAIYTLGVLCGSVGRLWRPEYPIADQPTLLRMCADLVQQSVTRDFNDSTVSTAGMHAYRNQGITGVRGEVAAGLPSVVNVSLPAYADALKQGLDTNHAGAIALLHLIATVQDTTLYHRGGTDGAAYAAQTARQLLTQDGYPSIEQIEALDDLFIKRNLSPGGCADLLAVTYFLQILQNNKTDDLC